MATQGNPSPQQSRSRGARAWLAFALAMLILGTGGVKALPAAPVAANVNGIVGAGLVVTPPRVVFTPGHPGTELKLLNTSTKTATYRIFWQHLQMTETGQLVAEKSPLPGDHFIDDMVLYAPRVVTLAPGQEQTVRLFFRRPAKLAPGEYRAHLVMQAVAPSNLGGNIQEAANPSSTANQKMAVNVVLVFSLGVPVLYRQEPTHVAMTLSDVKIAPDPKKKDGFVLTLVLHRAGNASSSGTITAELLTTDGPPTVIGQAGGVVVYAPNATRTLSLPLDIPKGLVLSGKTLHITYTRSARDGGGRLAETRVRLP